MIFSNGLKMRKTLLKAMLLIMGVVICTALVACGGDDDEPRMSETTKEVSLYEITYMVDASQGYLDFYNLTWSYVDSNGETKTEALHGMDSFDVNVPANVMPPKVGITIHATLRDTIPSYDENAIYEFGYSAQILVNRVYNDESVEFVGGDLIPNHQSLSVKGDKISVFLDKYTDFDIYSRTVSVQSL